MGETLLPVILGFNWLLRAESRADRLTGHPRAVLLREVLERSGIVSWMTARLIDPRSKLDVTHDLASLIRTLSRFTAVMAGSANIKVLRDAVLELAGRGFRGEQGGKKMNFVTLAVGSAPIEVQGHQPKAEWNGHDGARIYQLLITLIALDG